MCKIELMRLELDGVEKGVSVKFTDNKGKMVSIAFDDHPVIEDDGYGMIFYDYGIYRDCPIIDDKGGLHVGVTSADALRVLRDTLNRMDLGA